MRPLSNAHRLSLGVAVALLAPAFPGAAGAADYCVAPNTSCGGTNVATLEQALDLADNATDRDRIFLAAATYTASSSSGYDYSQPTAPVEIIGQGEGQTILTSPPAGGQRVLSLDAGAGSSVHDLTIRLPQNAAAGSSALYNSVTARQIEVTEDPTQANYRYGVTLVKDGSLEDATVTLAGEHHTAAVTTQSGTAVRRSQLSAGTGLLSSGATIERSRVSGSEYGIRALDHTTAITASVVRLTGSQGTGIYAQTEPTADTTVTADGVTIVSQPSPDIIGAGVSTANYPAHNADLHLTNSIIRGAANSLFADATGSGLATLTASHSDYDPSGDAALGGSSISEANVSNVGDAGFVDAVAGDYHLRPGSPLIDAGDPATPQGLDLDGNALVVDGNGDAIARRDMGAFEFEPAAVAAAGTPSAGADQQAGAAATDTQPPLVTGFIAARLARGTRFRYTLSEDARVTITIQRSLRGRRQGATCVRPTARLARAKRCTRRGTVGTLSRTATAGANSTRFSGRIGKRALRPGSYRAVIRATDAAGNRSTAKTARFRLGLS